MIFTIFDQSCGHTAYADDALNAKKMNVKLEGTTKTVGYLLEWEVTKNGIYVYMIQ